MAKIVVVGANHAGTSAINTILDLYPQNQICVFEQNDNISFLGCGMALWIGKQISKPDGLFYQTAEEFAARGVDMHVKTQVTKIDYDAHLVYATDKDGHTFTEAYDKLILATGSLPIKPTVEGMDLENVQQVKLFQDAKAVVEKLQNPDIKHVTVIGAGYIGVELAEAFQRNGRKVSLVDMAPTAVSGNFDAPFCERMDENLRSHGIDLHLNEKVSRFVGKDGHVCAVETDRGRYATDMVCVCVGFKPNAELWKDAGFETLPNGALKVDHHQRTSKPDVYAVGDCASVFNNAQDGENAYIALATNAVRSGIIAGHNACGTAIDSPGVQGSSGICIYDLKMVSCGLTEAKAKRAGYNALVSDFEGLQKASFIETPNPKVQIRIVYDGTTRKVLGAQMASTYDMSAGIHMFSLAIQEGITIDKLALLDIFFLPHFNEPYNYYTMAAYAGALNK